MDELAISDPGQFCDIKRTLLLIDIGFGGRLLADGVWGEGRGGAMRGGRGGKGWEEGGANTFRLFRSSPRVPTATHRDNGDD